MEKLTHRPITCISYEYCVVQRSPLMKYPRECSLPVLKDSCYYILKDFFASEI